MLPAGLDILGRPEGRKQNSPWASALGLDGVSEAHEALPDTKICGDAHVGVGLTPKFLRTQERPPIFCREDSMHNQM
jgi:hypothetical protein